MRHYSKMYLGRMAADFRAELYGGAPPVFFPAFPCRFQVMPFDAERLQLEVADGSVQQRQRTGRRNEILARPDGRLFTTAAADTNEPHRSQSRNDEYESDWHVCTPRTMLHLASPRNANQEE